MAPAAQKRKRPERGYSQDSNNGERPSPHRPQNLNIAQQSPQFANARGGRRSSRGSGRGGSQTPRSPSTSAFTAGTPTKASPTTTAMSPPPVPTVPKSVHTPTHAPAPAVQSPATAPVEVPLYFYEYLTSERVASWNADGKKAIVEAGAQAIRGDDPIVLATIFQEVIRAVQDNKLAAGDGGQAVREILEANGENSSQDASSLFLDSLTIVMETEPARPQLRYFISATNIDPARMRLELEPALLESLGLVRNTFYRIGIRKATSTLYRMSAYNLLREESEGYSKLLTEYFTTVQDRGSEGPRSAVVAETWDRVKALIGAFDLDVGRVLDVTLDVAANMLIKRGDFFVKFFRISTWWPKERSIDGVEWEHQGFTSLPRWAEPGVNRWTSTEDENTQLSALREIRDQNFWQRVKEVGMDAFFEIGSRRITNGTSLPDIANGEASGSAPGAKSSDPQQDIKWAHEWVRTTGTFPPQGNRIAAQLLGFKLRFYASDYRDATDVLPDNLIALTALLIKIGFISLVDLYPHLYPADEEMPVLKERLMKEKEEREKKARPGAGAMNALAMAGALADDTIAAPAPVSRLRAEESRASSVKPEDKSATKPEDEKPKLPEPANQKYELLKSLLCMGCLPESLFILGRFPWLLDGYPDIPQHVIRLVHQSIKNVYEACPPPLTEDVRQVQPELADLSTNLKGPLRLTAGATRRSMRWTKIEATDADGTGIDYRYFWESWTDSVPMCQTVDDVFLLCNTLVNLVGVKIGSDPKFLVKLGRIGRNSLERDPSEANRTRWIELSKRLLVPALSLSQDNLGAVNETYELLKLFPLQVRYNIYAEWYTGQTSRLPDIKVAFDLTRARTKDVLKRISKTNVRLMARNLAKVTLSSPGVVFSVTLNQIESYDNLIQTVIECTRYFTPLAYDVLNWALLNALAGGGRSRMQGDGMLTSSWLRALSQYTGGIFKQYKVMSPTPILQYVTDQLRRGSTTDLEILEQILTEMAGIRSDMNFTESQTQAMGGGPTLQNQTLQQLHDRRNLATTQDPAKRLLKSLVDSGVAAPLLIAIAQERQMYLHRDAVADAPLKVLGNNLDKIHQVFNQYLEVLRANLTPERFDKAIPNIASLVAEFGIDPSIAFTICRFSIHHEMVAVDTIAKEQAEKEKEEAKVKADSEEKPVVNGDIEMTDEPAGATNDPEAIPQSIAETKQEGSTLTTSTPTPVPTVADTPWHPTLKEVMLQLKPALPEDFEEKLSLSFYVSFWQLSLYDIFVPTSLYEEEQKRQKDRIQEINRDRSDISAAGNARKSRLRDACNAITDKLTAEMKTHVSTYQATRNRLKKESSEWFQDFPVSKTEKLLDTMLQECFLPRALLSPVDALYAFKMLMLVHSTGTPGFRTIKFLDQFFREKQITSVMFMCTAREAENFGRFLSELLKELERWRVDRSVYVKLAHGIKKDLPGFARKFGPDGRPDSLLDYEDFRRLCYKWHIQLSQAFKVCLNSGEYMHIRNAISILKATRNHFPSINFTGKTVMDSLKELQKDSREDIKLSATALMADLSRKEKDWIAPQAFRLADPNQPAARGSSRTPSVKPREPQPPSKSLNAAAPDFQPDYTASPSNDPTSKKDSEDGEIDDTPKTKEPIQEETESTSATVKPGNERSLSDVTSSTTIPSTPKSSSAVSNEKLTNSSIPSKPDMGRATPTQSAQSRASHALPARPEAPVAVRRPDERPAEYQGRGRPLPDSRRPLEPDYGRLERPGDPYNNHGYREARERSPDRRSRGRTPDRERRDPTWAAGREPRGYPDERGMRPPPRDARGEYPPRDAWDRPQEIPRDPLRDPRSEHARSSGWAEGTRDGWEIREPRHPLSAPDHRARGPSASGPPVPTAYHGPSRELPVHPDRAGVNQPPRDGFSQQAGVHPERAALAERDTQRHERDKRDRGSRPHSPRRDDMRGGPPHGSQSDNIRGSSRDERVPLPPPVIPTSRDGRRDESLGVAPTGPRSGNGVPGAPSGPSRGPAAVSGPRGASDQEYGRLNRDMPLPPRPPQDPNFSRPQQQDPNYGRLQQDTNYGRLNAAQDNTPSGPRGRGSAGRGGRNFTAPVPSSGGPASGASSMPSSPAFERNGSRDQRNPNMIDQGVGQLPPPINVQEQADLAGVHPSRLEVMRQDVPSIHTNTPPSGPRGRNGLTASSPITRSTPTGPALGPDREQRSQRGQNQLNNINNILQSGSSGNPPERTSNDRGTTIRGRGSRQQMSTGNFPQNTPGSSSQPSTPGGNRSDFPPPQPQQPPNAGPRGTDLFANRVSRDDGHTSSHSSAQEERSDSRRREGRERRSGHHHSRERSPRAEREGKERSSRREDGGRSESKDVNANGESSGRESRRSGRDEGREHGRERVERSEKEREWDRGERGEHREREHGGRREPREPRESRESRDNRSGVFSAAIPPKGSSSDLRRDAARAAAADGNSRSHHQALPSGREPLGPPEWEVGRTSSRGGRERRDGGGRDGSGRDGRKRGRPESDAMGVQGHGENKRPRRNG